MTRKPLILICYLLGSCAIGVNAQAPVANFSASTVAGCGPLGVSFKDLSSGNPRYWTWDFGNGQISSLQNPSVTYGSPGVYTVTLIVKNTSGANSIQKKDYITVYPYPLASFKSNLTLACAPANISFSDQSTPGQGTINQWSWDFGDGVTSNQQNPSHNYTQPGYYNVYLKVTNSGGCSNGINGIRYLRVISGIQPDFAWSQTSSSCLAPFLLQFNNQTAGPGNLTYAWDFGNGNGSALLNPTTAYPATSDYTVTLTVQSDLGCGGTTKKTISLPPVKTQIGGPDSACLNTPVNFLNNSTPLPLSSVWNFGDGTGANTPTPPGKTYSIANTYIVKLVNTYGTCRDSVLKNFKVLNNPVADFTATKRVTCTPPFTVNFQDLSSADTKGWQWDFGDGSPVSTQQNPSHTYTTAGSFDITLSATNATGCTGTKKIPGFVVINAPTLSLANPQEQGCVNSTGFTPTAVVNAVDGVASYSWSAPGATPGNSSSPSPTFTYAVQGSYDISLTVKTNDGCTVATTFSGAILVGNLVPAAFTAKPSDTCSSFPITFTATSTPVDHWFWDFGHGNTSQTGPVASFNFRDTGYRSITLTVVNSGCAQSINQNSTVHIMPPIARFKFQIDCSKKLFVNFMDSSVVDPTLPVLKYTWDFGDGSPPVVIPGPPNFPVTSHAYAIPGAYSVKLAVDNGGCENTYALVVTLQPQVADITIPTPSPCKNNQFLLNANVADPSIIAHYYWQVGSLPFAEGPPNYAASVPDTGTYPVDLIIEDINGCRDTASTHHPYSIHATGPAAKFIPASLAPVPGGCRNRPILFTDQSVPDPGTPTLVTWTWNFGDGSGDISLNTPFSHTYADTGTYTVKLTVQDSKGCVDSYTFGTPVQITSPHAGFFAKDTFYCPNAMLPFTDSSKGYILSLLWDFGDGSPPSTTPAHIFPTSGQKYNVKLKVTDQAGCSDSITRTNYIFIQKPIAAFSIADSTAICFPLQTTFTPNPQYYDSLYWDFGDGTTSTLPNTTHFYNSYDTFYAKLILRGPGGCLDSATRRIFVLNPYLTSFNYDPIKACDSVLTEFTTLPPAYTRFTLIFGDNSADSSSNNKISHLYKGPNDYRPQLYLQDSTGCIVGIAGQRLITVLGSTPFFGVDPHAFCDSGTSIISDFTITNDGILSKMWDFGDGSPQFVQLDPTQDLVFPHDFSKPGLSLLTLKVTTQSNCAENYTDTIRVHQTPHPVITVMDPTCATEPIRIQGDLTTPNVDPVTWLWNFGNGKTSGEQNPTIVYPASTFLRLSLRTSVPYGCSDTTSQLLDIHALPTVKGPPEISTPVGFPVTIPFTYSSGVIDYSWKPAAHLSCTDCSNPIADPKFSTLYVVTITDSNNCKISDSILVKTVCNDKNYFVPNTFSPNGDGVNDIFYPRGTNLYNIQSMRVFNRWGQLVFERRNFPSNSPSDGWDGRFNGRPAPGDAYVYIMEVICDNSQVVTLRGDVTLIR